MKIKLDENIPRSVIELLAEVGHQADTVGQEGLQGRSDAEVWAAAQQAGAFLVTQDLDFSDLRQFQPGRHRGILLLRFREPGLGVLTERLRTILRSEDMEGWRGCFVVATDHRIRVRRPAS